jgi:hypothetical protein
MRHSHSSTACRGDRWAATEGLLAACQASSCSDSVWCCSSALWRIGNCAVAAAPATCLGAALLESHQSPPGTVCTHEVPC